MKPEAIRISLSPVRSGRDLLINPVQAPAQTVAPREVPHGGKDSQRLWSAFWQDFAQENEVQERCFVPGDGRVVVDGHWAKFAAKLAGNASVIDIGSGAGTVGRTMLNHRPDLHITGIDWANVSAISMPNLSIYSGICMESLPFEAGVFDAAVSLFGIEYGSIDATARELQRVLRPGGRFNLIVHHRDSEILREGCARRQALRALISGKTNAAFLAGNGAGITQQRHQLEKHYPDEPMIKMVCDYFLYNIRCPRVDRQSMLEKLIVDLEPEIALLLHLDNAAKSPTEIAAWIVPLITATRLVSVSVLHRGSGEPIGWNISGIR